MFKKTKRKIVASIMGILAALWIGTLAIIYASSYFEMAKQNEAMLKAFAQSHTLSQAFEELRPPMMPFPGSKNEFEFGAPRSEVFQLSTFYTVAIGESGKVLEINNESGEIYTDSELEDLARAIIEKGKSFGTEKNLAFYRAEKSGYTLVVFKDNTVIKDSAMTLFRFTLLFGSLSLVLFFFLAVFLARKIVNPLEESDRKQKQFISDAGHELKTPVSVVSANADLLSREIGENTWLQNIRYENERMGHLVCQLLELSRTENAIPQTEPLDFGRLVAGEALPFESVAFEKGLTLNCQIGGEIQIKGNAPQLKQLVSILLDNAIRHSKGGTDIFLLLTKEHNFAKFSVINHGDPIPSDQREKIFERFYRLDQARGGEEKHYGLGLAIAKAIATSHKGSIEVFSSGGFVEFRVMLPLL